MIQFGANKGWADFMNVFQSRGLDGEKIFIPYGQLLRWVALRTIQQCVHFTKSPAR
jgi:hypothetical protein